MESTGQTQTPGAQGSTIRAPNQNTGGIDAGELIEKLLSNEHIPDHIRDQFWVLFGRTSKLTFINEQRLKRLMLRFELLRITALESIPPGDYQEGLESLLYSIGLEFEMNLCRSLGHRLNERELMGASTYATFAERPLSTGQENIPFFNRLIGAGKNLMGGQK